MEFTTDAYIPGIPDARFYWDADPKPFFQMAKKSLENERRYLASIGHEGPLPPAYGLAISGGGDNGAFGAGLLVGWTETGTRPDFKLVTGISTGALSAPFAFLGPEYDDQLKAVYTAIDANDIFEERGLTAALFDDALSDTTPLWGLISQYANEDLLAAIAEEYAKGRLLLIGTTNLDARRAVVWNMGAIASSEDPNALHLFRSILVASAAVPGAFPPVMIDVEVRSLQYQEMHVDGGAMAQVFVYPTQFTANQQAAKLRADRKLYIIRNARLDPDWSSVERRTLDIVGRSISSLIHTQGVGDLFQIYMLTQRDEIDFNLAFIGADFDAKHTGEFDPVFMKALFDYAYDQAVQGYPWEKHPPGFVDPSSE